MTDLATPRGRGWRTIPAPGPTAARGARSVWTILALLVWVGAVGPVVRARSLPAGQASLVAAVALGAVVLVVAARRSPWFVRSSIAVLSGLLLLPSQGELVAVWLVAGLLVGSWVALAEPPVPLLPRAAAGSTAPVVVLTGVAAVIGRRELTTWQPLVPLAAACAAPLLLGAFGGAAHRAAEWVGRRAGAVVGATSFAVLGIVALVVPWAGQRSLGRDPLRPADGWARRERRPIRSAGLWASDPVASPPGSLGRTAVVVLLAVAAVSGLVWQRSAARNDAVSAAALLADPSASASGDRPAWYEELVEDMAWVLDERVALRPFEVYRIADVETRHVNVRGGVRASWTPPPCECRRLRVWVYGGSGVFGLEQRDEHTIASALARRAHREGIVLDVENRGVPGQLHSRSALRFAYDLTYAEAPDIVLFVDGAHEVDAALLLSERGLGDTRAPFEPFNELLYEDLFGLPDAASPDPMVEDLGWPVVSSAPSDRPGDLSVLRYDRHRSLSLGTAQDHGVPVRYFWEPSWYDQPSALAAARRPDDQLERRGDAFAEARRALPTDVTDLGDAVAGMGPSVFTDEAVYDEVGADLVAGVILEAIRPDLVRLGAETAP